MAHRLAWEKRFGRAAAIFLSLVIGTLNTQGQSPAPRPEFEVASIKPSSSDGAPMVGSISPGALTARNAPLRILMRTAYQVRPFQIVGGPKWVDSDRFDISAKARATRASGGPNHPTRESNKEMFAMLRSLLEDRFQLRVHRETRELPVYVLTVPKAGHKMRPVNCTPHEPFDPSSPCGGYQADFDGPKPSVDGKGTSMQDLTAALVLAGGRTVIDKTGLTGRFNFHLEWAPEPTDAPGQNDPANPAGLGDARGPSLSNALQEQLGLKLEARKGPVEVIIIDHAEKPTVN